MLNVRIVILLFCCAFFFFLFFICFAPVVFFGSFVAHLRRSDIYNQWVCYKCSNELYRMRMGVGCDGDGHT